MKARILVIDDEEPIRQMMKDLLEQEGYEVVLARNGQEGIKAFFSSRPTLVVLDILMPIMNGWTLLQRIREVSEVPVIVLTALGRESDVVHGLGSGADDYVVKPARLDEFLSRVKVLLRRIKSALPAVQEEYSDSVLRLDFAKHLVYLRGKPVDLTPQEFRLLMTLVRNAGNVLTTDRLIDACWGEVGGPENVRVYIGYLRRKLGDDPRSPHLIQTVREFGYRYCSPENGHASAAPHFGGLRSLAADNNGN